MDSSMASLALGKSLLFRKDGTAQGVAKQRLIETIAEPEKRVIEDPYAECFVKGATIVKCMGHRTNVWLGTKLVPGMHEHLIARTRAIDDLVKECAAAGACQYLILGAGYDSRPHRLELPSSLNIFEVDQREVQELKKSRLPHDVLAKSTVSYVDVDFSTQTLTDQLTKAGFVIGQRTVITLEGVSQYIPKEAAAATLNEVSALCGAGSTIFVSYVDQLVREEPAKCCGEGYPKPAESLGLVPKLSASVGEPWISYYTPAEMQAVLAPCGFVLLSDTTLADVNEKYFGAVGRLVPQAALMLLERFAVATK